MFYNSSSTYSVPDSVRQLLDGIDDNLCLQLESNVCHQSQGQYLTSPLCCHSFSLTSVSNSDSAKLRLLSSARRFIRALQVYGPFKSSKGSVCQDMVTSSNGSRK